MVEMYDPAGPKDAVITPQLTIAPAATDCFYFTAIQK